MQLRNFASALTFRTNYRWPFRLHSGYFATSSINEIRVRLILRTSSIFKSILCKPSGQRSKRRSGFFKELMYDTFYFWIWGGSFGGQLLDLSVSFHISIFELTDPSHRNHIWNLLVIWISVTEFKNGRAGGVSCAVPREHWKHMLQVKPYPDLIIDLWVNLVLELIREWLLLIREK